MSGLALLLHQIHIVNNHLLHHNMFNNTINHPLLVSAPPLLAAIAADER